MKAFLTLLATVLAATALAASASAADSYSPGERYVPFVTDFPNHGPEAAPAGVEAQAADGFDGFDAAIGAAVGLALGVLAAASLPALRRRRSLSTA